MYGRILQTIGIIAVIVAIQIEIITRQDLWMIITTAGSLLFAIGTKLVYFRKK